jgi:KDO2-lipid IV(A) lauroyltransferase
LKALFFWFARWPLAVLHPLGAALGWCVWLLSPAVRRAMRDNGSRAGQALSVLRRSVAHAGRMVAELPRLWLGAPVPVYWDGDEHILQAHADGCGILFMTPHLGCFEITASAYAQRFGHAAGQPARAMTVLFRPPRQAWLREVVFQARQRPGLQTAPTTLAGVRQLVRVLRAGGAVGLLPDQVPPLGQGVWAPFFGQLAYTMTLSVRLARTANTRVLLAWGERLPAGRGYVVHVQPWALPDTPDDVAACTALNQAMEGLIRQCPSQYLWSYARYKQPRELP